MVLRQGAWINVHTDEWSFVDEHANWAKREGRLQRIGLPDSVWEAIRPIANDYGGEGRKGIVLTVMEAGGIRMRAHRAVVVFEFTVDTALAVAACHELLDRIAGPLTRCRFSNLRTNEAVEVSYEDYRSQVECILPLR